MVVKAFNGVFFGLFGVTAAVIVAIWLLFRNRSEKSKQTVLITLCGLNFLIFCVYKYFLAVDPGYTEAFNWWSELPLHLCNINMFLIPIGVLTKKRGLMGFSFFLAPLGAIMATIFPEPLFDGYSLALPRILGFYTTHLLIIVCGATLATLDLYRPKIKDLPRITVTFIALALVSFGINAFLQKIVGCDTANYFFTWYHSDISILKTFWNLIPLPFLYELPALLILLVYVALICDLFWCINRWNHRGDDPLVVNKYYGGLICLVFWFADHHKKPAVTTEKEPASMQK